MKIQNSNDFFRKLQKYKLNYLIVKVSNMITEMFNKSVPFLNMSICIDKKIYLIKGQVTVSAWGLSDILFYAIKTTDDFKNIVASDQEIIDIVNSYLAYDEIISAQYIPKDKEDDISVFSFLLGLSQQEFPYQLPNLISYEYTRNYELLDIISCQDKEKINVNQICIEVLGISKKEIDIIIIFLFLYAKNTCDFTSIIIDPSWNENFPFITLKNVNAVILYYTANYSEYRNSNLEERFFCSKPFIRTTQNRIYCLNIYLLWKKIADGPYWIVRNYFMNIKSQDFTNYFGYWFETYLNRLFTHYLSISQFNRIECDEFEKRADWFVFTTKYRLVIEQKSTLSSILIKKQYVDQTHLLKFLNLLNEAINQINTTISSIKSELIDIKIVLLYDNFYIPEGLFKPQLNNEDEKLFIVGIDEFEKIIYLLKNDPNKLDELLKFKISQNSLPISQRLDLSQMLKDTENDYLSYLNHWGNIKNYCQKN